MGKLKASLTSVGAAAAHVAQRLAPQSAERSESARGAKAPECPL